MHVQDLTVAAISVRLDCDDDEGVSCDKVADASLARGRLCAGMCFDFELERGGQVGCEKERCRYEADEPLYRHHTVVLSTGVLQPSQPWNLTAGKKSVVGVARVAIRTLQNVRDTRGVLE